jgi:hypothetical protein
LAHFIIAHLVTLGLCDGHAALVFTLMEDIISMTTITDAEGVFDYLESRILKLRQVLL